MYIHPSSTHLSISCLVVHIHRRWYLQVRWLCCALGPVCWPQESPQSVVVSCDVAVDWDRLRRMRRNCDSSPNRRISKHRRLPLPRRPTNKDKEIKNSSSLRLLRTTNWFLVSSVAMDSPKKQNFVDKMFIVKHLETQGSLFHWCQGRTSRRWSPSSSSSILSMDVSSTKGAT